MNVTINGKPQQVEPQTTVADLLARLGVQTALVAVELNHNIVPKSRHRTTGLTEGDAIEIVTLVGGG